MIAIVDYGMGNVLSVRNSLEYLGLEAEITRSPEVLRKATHLILPGVGAFGDAMKNLDKLGLVKPLEQEILTKNKPLLGICLGLQLMAKSSLEHGSHRGLGWFDADVVPFQKEQGMKIPHMGWNRIGILRPHPVFEKIQPDNMDFYFVHSFHMVCHEGADVLATCDYGIAFTAAVSRGNIVATQFHPEKSQDSGLQFLENFSRWTP